MVTPSIFWNGTGLPAPSRVRPCQSTVHGPFALTFTFVAEARSAEKSSKPHPDTALTLVLVDVLVGRKNAIARAPTPGVVPLASSRRYVYASLSMYFMATSMGVPRNDSRDSLVHVEVWSVWKSR